MGKGIRNPQNWKELEKFYQLTYSREQILKEKMRLLANLWKQRIAQFEKEINTKIENHG